MKVNENFKVVFNEYTQQEDIQFTGKFIKLTSERLENVNEKGYYRGLIEFVNADGEVKRANCNIFETHFEKGIEEGQEYLCTASFSKAKNRYYIQMSNLPRPLVITSSDFGIEENAVKAVEKQGFRA